MQSPFSCPAIENIVWIETLLIGHLSYKVNFSLSKGDLLKAYCLPKSQPSHSQNHRRPPHRPSQNEDQHRVMLQKIRFFDKMLSELFSWMTIFKSIHMAFYVNPSWACALFRNNKQHVVLGQKRKCQRVEESRLWRIQRERWIEVKYLPNGTNAGYM